MKTIRLFALSLLIMANALPVKAQSSDLIKKNIKIAYESLNKRDYATFKTVCAQDFVELTAGPAPIKGTDASIEAYKMFFAMAPDLKLNVKSIIIDGKRAILETTATGTNTGMVMGMLPPSGKKIMANDIEVITFNASGKATSHRNTNPNEIFNQIGYSALINPNTGLVMDIYGKFGKGDVAGIAASCADNVVWDISDNPFVKMPQVYTNNKDIPKFFADLMASGEVTKFEPVRFLADGDDVVCILHVGFKSKTNGKNWTSTFAHHFKIMNGKVVTFKEITTTPMEMK